MKPKRIQRKRIKNWKMPSNTVYVGRPSIWGNIFKGENAVEKYAHWLRNEMMGRVYAKVVKLDLKGKNLCCWCKLSEKCHGDILLEIANE